MSACPLAARGSEGRRLYPQLPTNRYNKRRVAVETRIAPRPPHRSRRALLTHRALPLGSGVEAV